MDNSLIAKKQTAQLNAHIDFLQALADEGISLEHAAVYVQEYLRGIDVGLDAIKMNQRGATLRAVLVKAGIDETKAREIISTNGRIYDAIVHHDAYTKRAIKDTMRRKGYR